MTARAYQLPDDVRGWHAQKILAAVKALPDLFYTAALGGGDQDDPFVLQVASPLAAADVDELMMKIIKTAQREQPPGIVLG